MGDEDRLTWLGPACLVSGDFIGDRKDTKRLSELPIISKEGGGSGG